MLLRKRFSCKCPKHSSIRREGASSKVVHIARFPLRLAKHVLHFQYVVLRSTHVFSVRPEKAGVLQISTMKGTLALVPSRPLATSGSFRIRFGREAYTKWTPRCEYTIKLIHSWQNQESFSLSDPDCHRSARFH